MLVSKNQSKTHFWSHVPPRAGGGGAIAGAVNVIHPSVFLLHPGRPSGTITEQIARMRFIPDEGACLR
jgi:hypothetical protein